MQKDVRSFIMKKSGRALSHLAGEFLALAPGERVPTFAELSKRSGFSRGTLQNAMSGLVNLGAIALSRHGAKGSFLLEKNTGLLLQCGGITHISGIMPLPYTKTYEGLATGLFNTLQAAGHVAVDLAYMRGSDKRVAAVLEGRYDFAVTSRLAAREAVAKGLPVAVAADLGAGSYLSGHSLMLRDPSVTEIRDKMRVGVDPTSLDHAKLTKLVTSGVDVTLIPVNYNQVITLIQRAEIDAAVWNNDHIVESRAQVNHRPIEHPDAEDGAAAVLVMRSDRAAMRAVLEEFLDLPAILAQQREVIEDRRYPNY